MKARRKRWLRIFIYCSLVFACATGADLIGFSALGRGAELRSYDLRFKIRGPLPASPRAPITILAIDEESLAGIPNPLMLWQREYAQILENLASEGAGVVGIDFIFSDVSKIDPEGQRELGQAVLQAGTAGMPLVLAYRVRPSGVEQPPMTLRLTALAAGHTLAYANLTTDMDDFVRRQQIFAPGADKKENPGFALAIAERFAQKYQRPFVVPDLPGHSLLINYRGPGCFRQVSFGRALEAARKGDKEFFRANFRDSVVLIGRVGNAGDEDLHSTPQYFFDSGGRRTGSVRTPGVEIHGHTIATLLENDHLRSLTPVRQRAAAFALVLLVAFLCFRLSPVLAPLLSGLAVLGYLAVSCLSFFSGWWIPVVAPVAGAVLLIGCAEIADYILEGREKRRLKDLFMRYVDDQVVEKILEAPEALVLHGERRQVTILFADIRDFTARAEGTPAAVVVGELNEYLTEMVTVIQKNGGMVDKFLGDGIMAIFGTPVEDPHSAYNGVQAALGMIAALRKLNARFAKRGVQPLSIGIGIHSGEAVVGNIGCPQKLEYTAIGDAVNVASRIEGLTRALKAQVLISGDTFAALNGRIPATPLGEEHVRGRTQSVPVYAVVIPGE